MILVATGGAAVVALLLYCYFENVKEDKDFVQNIKRIHKVAPPAGGAEECGDT